ncbi:16S rRNA (guanine(527)-N(7))-methyltransferase RsmG [Laspinema olomoucense]|uniref:Ribosomal RNA small subunit methyltransferase G n=1 Tax=Laspinema olomoucense D3b TaxID=2953688 RepID=A0ABT2N7V2_9CYAN|nr:16S rRNA (guanine(527)-N(7))-methyltransferase RsmG [Laspinema sp. D3b]MCT7978776.1 16S rRNA (guanine(527)-N(7))-methyltransferase RsmG [Laspinema sp. D3b]
MSEPDKPVLPSNIKLWEKTMNWQPDAGHLLEFQSLYEGILQGNQSLNLTRITAPDEFWEKHLWDSLRGITPLLSQPLGSTTKTVPLEGGNGSVRAIDIGTGAGFPGLPVAIACPEWQVTLIDSTRKKITFLQSLINQLGMENAQAIVGRVEEMGRSVQHRERYDFAFARAIGPTMVCAEYALPLLKVGGLAILYRGHWTEEEAQVVSAGVEQLGGIVDFVEKFTTPLTDSVRTCVYLRKVAPTRAEFPRAVGIPAQNPLL